MSPRLKISSSVIERLSKLETNESTGCLYGLMYDGTLLVVGLSIELFQNEKHAYNHLLLNFPAEIELCGVVKFQDDLSAGTLVKEILQDVDITDNPLVILMNKSKELKANFLVHDKFEETNYEVLSTEELWRQFLHVRLNTVLPLICEATINGVKNMMQTKRKKIASGQVSFHIDNTSVYLFGVASDVGLTGTSVEATVGELDILPVNFIMKASKDILSEKLVKTAVKMMTTQRKPSFCIKMPLRIDTLAMIHRSTKLLDLYTVLVEAACRSLRLLESVLLEQLGEFILRFCIKMPLRIDTLAMIHRSTKLLDLYTVLMPLRIDTLAMIHRSTKLLDLYTVLMPLRIDTLAMIHRSTKLLDLYTVLVKKVSATGLACVYQRHSTICRKNWGILSPERTLHEQLALPLNRPIFRRGNAHIDKTGGKLVNPHEAVPSQARPDVTVAVVRGRYTYHHYMQDSFNDDGWGYKPSSFVGSRQWIGSTEVMFCLETLLGVTSRIVFANTGQELQSYVPELKWRSNLGMLSEQRLIVCIMVYWKWLGGCEFSII
ncbi:Uncharacterized protein OBRU01_04511 [Operophtera brumata]|uniref:Uncharacterized protein n=1 Tax=Operophtera brumata TaxID=104452 RepID=A0A0L7LP23_OPEBR|nr:Uncharacterized protein OBRU01_04511 [Operophtera brumata]